METEPKVCMINEDLSIIDKEALGYYLRREDFEFSHNEEKEDEYIERREKLLHTYEIYRDLDKEGELIDIRMMGCYHLVMFYNRDNDVTTLMKVRATRDKVTIKGKLNVKGSYTGVFGYCFMSVISKASNKRKRFVINECLKFVEKSITSLKEEDKIEEITKYIIRLKDILNKNGYVFKDGCIIHKNEIRKNIMENKACVEATEIVLVM